MFKPGDLVMCIDNERRTGDIPPFNKDTIYKVKRDHGNNILIEGFDISWYKDRFVKVTVDFEFEDCNNKII